jgi:hypothetical protein
LFLAFFDLSSLRTHFWPLPFPSENFGGHGKKVLRETADPPSPKLLPVRKATARRHGVTGDAMSRIQSKTERELQATRFRNASAWQARLPLRKERKGTKVFRNQVRSESTFISLVLCAEITTANGRLLKNRLVSIRV